MVNPFTSLIAPFYNDEIIFIKRKKAFFGTEGFTKGGDGGSILFVS